uniref:Secreted protein n=1 Tax=Steinernema glaseri TaxID=37863 RepID=A0A1I7ZJ87_9BILA
MNSFLAFLLLATTALVFADLGGLVSGGTGDDDHDGDQDSGVHLGGLLQDLVGTVQNATSGLPIVGELIGGLPLGGIIGIVIALIKAILDLPHAQWGLNSAKRTMLFRAILTLVLLLTTTCLVSAYFPIYRAIPQEPEDNPWTHADYTLTIPLEHYSGTPLFSW